MMKPYFLMLIMLFAFMAQGQKNNMLLVEAESFAQKGGWVIDQQFMDVMGSSFLLAHGMGIPVKDAVTEEDFPTVGKFRLFVRTRNWAMRWNKADAPGKFKVLINGQAVDTVFGNRNDEWRWQDGGTVTINKKRCQLALHDLTGFDGRCDALLFTSDLNFIPPSDAINLNGFREELLPGTKVTKDAGHYDFVIVGGGLAGTCAAISAARLGVKVALIQDRPLVGGNNSSEVRVHLGGRVNLDPYPALGNLVNEIGPSREGNAQPYENYEDKKKMDAVRKEKNISLFLNCHADRVNVKNGRIESIRATNTETGLKLLFTAPLFADCTGDATIGILSGAKYMTGRESSAEFGEKTAPEKADKLTMGSSVQWYAEDQKTNVAFPDITWGLEWNEQKAQKITRGDWQWETGMGLDQVKDFERIRDYGLMVVYSNWSFLKNHSSVKEKFAGQQLQWVAYIAGKRESNRLVGDYILRESDLTDHKVYNDGTASASWTIDLHYPDPENSKQFPGEEYKAVAVQVPVYPYPFPFRCLYSANIPNLMMAGRDISVTHVALGAVRVQRTTGMMGEVIGMAASICKQHHIDPKGVYTNYLEELKTLMLKGTGNPSLPKIQNYNLGETKAVLKSLPK